jgi:sulfite dehydrogenase (cytochrome) subunit B
MKRILVIFLLLILATGFAYAPEKQLIVPIINVELAASAGKDRVETHCHTCHSLDYITMQPKSSKTAWASSVPKMRKIFGAPISDADAAIITNYLTTFYGSGK